MKLTKSTVCIVAACLLFPAASVAQTANKVCRAKTNLMSVYGQGDYAKIQQFIKTKNPMLAGKQPTSVVPRFGWPNSKAAGAESKSAEVDDSSGDYYAEQINGGAMKWAAFPLRVYVGGGGPGYRPEFRDAFLAALSEWSSAAGGSLFSSVDDPSAADIEVCWQAAPSEPIVESGDTRAQWRYAGGTKFIYHAKITLLSYVNGIAVSDAQMKRCCLHELGHALGMVHTSNPADIMYFQENASQKYALSMRDAVTLRKMYTGQG